MKWLVSVLCAAGLASAVPAPGVEAQAAPQAATPNARPVPPTRDPHTPGYVTAAS